MSDADLDALKRDFEEALLRNPVRIIGIKRSTRARWWLAHRVDGIAIWLTSHGRYRAATALWRVTGLW